jgi:calnexin
MMFATTPSAFHGISTRLRSPFDPGDQTLVIQYEVRFQDSLNCSGGYIKLFGAPFDPSSLSNSTDFLLMFGPDICGRDARVHLIIKHRGVYKALRDPPAMRADRLTNLYTLVIRPDSSFDVRINERKVRRGSLFSDFEPPINGLPTLDDPRDVRPADWDDRETIDDPALPRPDGWDDTQPEFVNDPERLRPPERWFVDEPEYIPDPKATRPAHWNAKRRGQWRPPMMANPKCLAAVGCGRYTPPKIRNPKYRGPYVTPQIPNPNFRGKWVPRQIPNPDFVLDDHPNRLAPIVAAGFELWTIDGGVGFDNIIISNNEKEVRMWNKKIFVKKKKAQEERIYRDLANIPDHEEPQDETWLDVAIAVLAGLIGFWCGLYDASKLATVALTLFIAILPLRLCLARCFCCRRRRNKGELAPEEKAMLLAEVRKKRIGQKKKSESVCLNADPPDKLRTQSSQK